MRRKFQPRACIAARSFLLEGRSGSSLSSRTVLLASRSRNSQLPVPPCGDRTNPLRVGERDAESAPISDQLVRFSPDHVFPRGYCSYRKGNTCSCSVASNVFGQLGSVQQLPTPPAVALVAMHPRRTQGWDDESANFGSFSFLSRPHAAAIALIGADTPRSFSRREGTIDSKIPVAPGGRRYPFGQPSQHRDAGGEELRTQLPVSSRQAFLSPVALSRDYLRYGEGIVSDHAFRHGHQFLTGF